jgi:hypothetical protein
MGFWGDVCAQVPRLVQGLEPILGGLCCPLAATWNLCFPKNILLCAGGVTKVDLTHSACLHQLCMVACCMAWLLMRVSLVSAQPPPSRVRKSLPGYEGSNLRGLVPMHDACACGLRCPPPLLAGHAIQTSCARCLLPVCSRIFKVQVVCVLFVTTTQRGCGRLHAALSVRH